MATKLIVEIEEGKLKSWKVEGPQTQGLALKQALITVIEELTNTALNAVLFSSPAPEAEAVPPDIKRKRH